MRAWPLVFVLLPGLACGEAATIRVPETAGTIFEALARARPGDVIELAPGTYSARSPGERFPLEISVRDLTLRGAGVWSTILDGDARVRLLRVRAPGFRLQDLTLQRGAAEGEGGALLVEDCDPEIARVRFQANAAGEGGGAAALVRSRAHWTNCLLVGNGPSRSAVRIRDGEPVIERTTFHGNAGAALELRGTARPRVRQCIFSAPRGRSGPAVGIWIAAAGTGGAPGWESNLFAGCAQGAVRVEGVVPRRLLEALERARARGALREGDPRFLDPGRGDFRLGPESAGRCEEVGALAAGEFGAFGGPEPMPPPPHAAATAERMESPSDSTTLLGPSVPNPFRPSTTIHFTLPEAGVVDLGIYNVLGQRIRTLHAGELPAGEHARVWDGRDDLGEDVPPGIYFVRVTSGRMTESQRVVLMR